MRRSLKWCCRSVLPTVALGTLLAGLLAATGCSTTGKKTVAQTTGHSAIVSEQFIYKEAPYPQSHASTIAETSDGKLVASWFGGTHERHPDVSIWVSHFSDGKWEEAVKVADGVQSDGTRHPTWNPVLFQPPRGDLFLFYKVGPNPREWWGMAMTSADGGRTWSEPERLPDGILGPIKNKPIVLSHGGWLSPSSTEHNGWLMHFEHSRDQGKTWKATDPVEPGPVHFDAIQPSLLTHADGRIQAVARTRQGVIGSSWSMDRGETWSDVAAIDLPNPNSGIDAVTLEDGRQLMVYNHSAHSPTNKAGKGLRYPLNLAISEDGLHWEPVLTIEDKPRPDGYAYPAIIQSDDGLVHVTYTWDRERIKHVVVDPSKL